MADDDSATAPDSSEGTDSKMDAGKAKKIFRSFGGTVGGVAAAGSAKAAGITGAAAGGGFALGRGVVGKIIEKAPPMEYNIMLLYAIFLSFMNYRYSQNTTFRLILYVIYLLGFYFFFRQDIGSTKWMNAAIFFTLAGLFAADLGNLAVSSVLPGPEAFRQFVGFIILLLGYMGPIIWLLNVHHEPNWMSTAITVALFLLIVFFASRFLVTLDVLPEGQAVSSAQSSLFVDIGSGLWDFVTKDIPALATGTYNRTRDEFNQSIGKITGKSYEEEVDANAGVSTLGVIFEDLEFSNKDRTYFQGDPISAWAGMEAKTLDREINVELGCFVDRREGQANTKVGTITEPQFTVTDLTYQVPVCTFDRDVFDKPDDHELELIADFGFTTNSYLRRYFVKQEDFLALQKNDVDLQQYYNIPAEDEFGRFTNGPLAVSISTHNLIQPLTSDKVSLFLGFAFDTNRRAGFENGRLMSFDNLVIAMPPEFTLARTQDGFDCGQYEFVEYDQNDCIADCGALSKGERCVEDCSELNQYRLDLSDIRESGLSLDKTRYGEEFVKTPFTIPCFVETTASQAIGQQAIGINNFRATADYQFEIGAKKTFKVAKKDGYVNTRNQGEYQGYTTFFLGVTPDKTPTEIQAMIDNAQEFLDEAQPFLQGNLMPQSIIEALIAYNYRNGVENKRGIGLTGIQRAQLESIGAPTVNVTENHQEIAFTGQYLVSKIDGEECQNIEKNLDCGLSLFLCGETTGACSETLLPQIYALAQELE